MKDLCLTGKKGKVKSIAKELNVSEEYLILLAEALRLRREIAAKSLNEMFMDEVFFEQSPINSDELDDYKLLAERLRTTRLHQLSANDREKLLQLALRFTPARHKMVALPPMLENLILEGRALFREKISSDNPDAFSFHDVSQYIYSETILNNIFFGKTTFLLSFK